MGISGPSRATALPTREALRLVCRMPTPHPRGTFARVLRAHRRGGRPTWGQDHLVAPRAWTPRADQAAASGPAQWAGILTRLRSLVQLWPPSSSAARQGSERRALASRSGGAGGLGSPTAVAGGSTAPGAHFRLREPARWTPWHRTFTPWAHLLPGPPLSDEHWITRPSGARRSTGASDPCYAQVVTQRVALLAAACFVVGQLLSPALCLCEEPAGSSHHPSGTAPGHQHQGPAHAACKHGAAHCPAAGHGPGLPGTGTDPVHRCECSPWWVASEPLEAVSVPAPDRSAGPLPLLLPSVSGAPMGTHNLAIRRTPSRGPPHCPGSATPALLPILLI